MIVLISSSKLSIVPYAAGPESRGHSRTAFANISILSCFPSFIVHWILNFEDQPSHENWYPTNKSDFTVYSQCRKFYITFFLYVEEILSQPFCGTTSLLLLLNSDWMIVVVWVQNFIYKVLWPQDWGSVLTENLHHYTVWRG
jgi:hypothetical protein